MTESGSETQPAANDAWPPATGTWPSSARQPTSAGRPVAVGPLPHAWPSTRDESWDGSGDGSWDGSRTVRSSLRSRSARRSPRRVVPIAAVVVLVGFSVAVLALRGGSSPTATSTSPAFGTSTTSPDTTIPHVAATAPPPPASTPTTVPTRAAQTKFLKEVRADTALDGVPASPLVRAGSAACAAFQRGSSYDDAVDTSITELIVYHATMIDGGAVVDAAVGSLCPQYADVGGGIGLES